MRYSTDVTLDGSGNGVVKLPPPPPYQTFVFTQVSVKINTGENSYGGYAEVYAGDAIPVNRVDGTRTPWLDSIFNTIRIIPPLQLTVIFGLCEAGAIATVSADYTVAKGY